MYESPIEMISRQVRTQQEENVYKAVLEVGVNVDKDELIKALKYDRDQYNRGYHDGLVHASMLRDNARAEVAREIFEKIEKILTTDGYLAFGSVRKYTELKKKYTEDQNNEN